MTPSSARPGLRAREHAQRILLDRAAPTPARAQAARTHLDAGAELDAPHLDELLSIAATEADDALWATLINILALEHPDVRALWEAGRAGLDRLGALAPRRAAEVIAAILRGGTPAPEVAGALVAALGEAAALAILARIHPARELDGLPEDLRSRAAEAAVALERGLLFLHLIALCDPATRRALGRSAAYSRYRSVAWAIQDWPFEGADQVARWVARGSVRPAEAPILAAFSARVRDALGWGEGRDPGEEELARSAELDRLGQETLAQLGASLEVEAILGTGGAPGAIGERWPARGGEGALQEPPGPGPALEDLERDVRASLRAAAEGEEPGEGDARLLELYLDTRSGPLEVSDEARALAERAIQGGLGAADEPRLRLAILGVSAAGDPADAERLAAYAEAHARAEECFDAQMDDRFERAIAQAIDEGAPVAAIDRILVKSHGERWAASTLSAHWRAVARALADRADPPPRQALLEAARTFARSEALGALSTLCVPALRERLGLLPWLEAFPSVPALLRGWAASAASSPDQLRALGAVSAQEAAALEGVGAAVAQLLARSSGGALPRAAVDADPTLAAALAAAGQQLGLAGRARMDALVHRAHALPDPRPGPG